MDEDVLDRHLERWRRAGVIDATTAAAIREFERRRARTDTTRVRYATVLGLMGAAFVGAGILAFLAANWGALGWASRTSILLGAPAIAAFAGIALERKENPLVGRAAWVLSIVLIGPSLTLLIDTYGMTVDPHWILLGWAVFALPMGHAFRTNIGVSIGLVAVLLAVVMLADAPGGAFAAGWIGAVFVGVASRWVRDADVATSYRLVGPTPVIATLLWLNTLEGAFHRISVGFEPLLLGAAGTAVAVGLGVWLAERHRHAPGNSVTFVAGSILAVLLALIVVSVGTSLPAAIGYGIVQAILLGYLLLLVVVAVEGEFRALINLVVLGFLLQVITLLITVSDVLPGSLALVVAGLSLLVVAIALERGRRHLLARMGH